jgi:hypothetical protein
VVGSEFVVARRDPPTLFDLVEEPFDQIARTVEIRAAARFALQQLYADLQFEIANLPTQRRLRGVQPRSAALLKLPSSATAMK